MYVLRFGRIISPETPSREEKKTFLRHSQLTETTALISSRFISRKTSLVELSTSGEC